MGNYRRLPCVIFPSAENPLNFKDKIATFITNLTIPLATQSQATSLVKTCPAALPHSPGHIKDKTIKPAHFKKKRNFFQFFFVPSQFRRITQNC